MEGMGDGHGDSMGATGMPLSPSIMPMTMDHGHGQDNAMPMHMTFFWGKDAVILFPFWPGDTGIGMYLLALFVILVLAAVSEALMAYSNRLSKSRATGSNSAILTAIHAFKMGVLYLVMLAVMSFNVGVFLAALAGHAVGFFLGRSGFFLRQETGDLEAHK